MTRRRVVAAGLTLLALWPAAGCRLRATCPHRPPMDRRQGEKAPAPPVCWTLARVPGPEDLVVDGVHRRLLVASQEQRVKPRPRGAIWSVPLDPGQWPYELELRGRDDCSFHPHGIDLVQGEGFGWLLYVINQEDPEDWSPERGCLPGGGLPGVGSKSPTSVEVYAVEKNDLRFLQRLADPRVLTHGNDLAALPGGDVWVTNPPAGGLALALDAKGLWPRSKIDHFRCRSRIDGRCTGTWETATISWSKTTKTIPAANGIAWRPCPAGSGDCAGELYVAAFGAGSVFSFAMRSDGSLQFLRALGRLGGASPDNLTWADADRTTLLVAAHPDLRRFVQHSRDPEIPSPSEVFEIPLTAGAAAKCLFCDDGSLISASSVAVPVRNGVVLGQVFEPAVLRCQVPGAAPEGPAP